MVLNHTYTCFFAQQEIPISLMANGWLHKGSLVCPACSDVCGEEFEARGGKGENQKRFECIFGRFNIELIVVLYILKRERGLKKIW